MHERTDKLFVGVGNLIRRDDGVGVRAAEIMSHWPLPPDVEVYDAGTAGLEIAGVIERRERVVVVDAIEAGAEPGEIFRLTPQQLRPYLNSSISLHDVHLLDALDETNLLGTAPREVVILAVQVADVSAGIGLTPAVEHSLPRVLKLAARELDLPAGIMEQAAAPSP